MIYIIGGLILLVFVLMIKLSSAKADASAARNRTSSMELQVESLLSKNSQDKISYENERKTFEQNIQSLNIILQQKKSDLALLKKDVSILAEKERTHKENLEKLLASNLTSMPWLAGMMADFFTYDLEVEAKKLDWGSNVTREKKVRSIRDIRRDAESRIEEAKEATYQLAYLRQLFPDIDDILGTEYKDLDLTGHLWDGDPTRNFLSSDEWARLTESERNQLALDRYVESRQKSQWQVGRDYELAVAYEYMCKVSVQQVASCQMI